MIVADFLPPPRRPRRAPLAGVAAGTLGSSSSSATAFLLLRGLRLGFLAGAGSSVGARYRSMIRINIEAKGRTETKEEKAHLGLGSSFLVVFREE